MSNKIRKPIKNEYRSLEGFIFLDETIEEGLKVKLPKLDSNYISVIMINLSHTDW